MAERIYLCLAHMSGNEQKYVKEAFDTNWVVPLGPNVNAFEEDLKSFVESAPQPPKGGEQPTPDPSLKGGEDRMQVIDEITVWPKADWAKSTPTQNGEESMTPPSGGRGAESAGREIVALSAGTAAVHLSLLACGVGPGDEVICQSFTFCASCHPITYLGATPVLVDSEPDTWNMDPQLLEEAIKDRIAKTGKKPKAIVPVYLYGMPAKLDEIMEIANRYEIPVIEDAAEGLGSRYKGRVCGTFGKYGVLSFNGNKMITTSGGGALICPDKEAKQKIMFYATQARESYPYYQHEEIGYNYRMSNICAGIGRGQMTVLEDHIAHHRMLAKFYEEEFSKIEGITFHSNPNQPTPDPSLKGREKPKGGVQKSADPVYYEELKKRAKNNRNNPTEAERLMWDILSNKKLDDYKFRRQHIIGQYIVDFVCLEKMLVIEVDGGYHNNPDQKEDDEIRQSELERLGYRVIRFTNEDVLSHTYNVIDEISAALESPLQGDRGLVYDSNYWLNTIVLDENLKVKGEDKAYAAVVTGAVGGAAGVTHAAESAHTDCEPNTNVEAMRLALDKEGIESRPLWKPMHKQPVYANVPAYTNGVSESLFKRGLCLPSGPYVTLEDAKRIVEIIKENIVAP